VEVEIVTSGTAESAQLVHRPGAPGDDIAPPSPRDTGYASRAHETEAPVRERSVFKRYAYACLSVLGAALARILLDRVFGYHHPYATFYIAALLSAWYGGVGPALLSTLGGAGAIILIAFAPAVVDRGGANALVGFEFYFIVSLTGIILLEAQRRAERRSARLAELARRRLLELEEATGQRLRAEAETREALERLHEAQKLESIGLLAGGIAHDFNNLLTGIMGSASLALETVPPEGTAHRMLGIVLSSADRAAQLTKQLLAYAGKGSYVTDLLDLSELARQASEAVRPVVSPAIEFRFELREELPQLRADSSQIRQLIVNLIENAAEAIGENRHGIVTLRTDVLRVEDPRLYAAAAAGQIAAGTYLVLQVEDTGEGVDAILLPGIFDPFVTTKFMGRGLGLAAVSGIARALKGAVLVSSKRGEGSLFSVLFPVLEDSRR
jgi:signal transduction histidine kinase